MLKSFSIAIAMAIVMSTTAAASDPIKDRRASMKSISKANKKAGNMLKGKAAFDLATVQATLKVLQDEAQKSKGLYPAGSNKGKTRALPAVWTDNKDFLARFDKLAADAKSLASKIKDEASFKANYKTVFKSCGGCHKLYRAKKKKKKK